MQTSKTPLALIVGGSSGIGKQSAIRLLNRDAEVMLLAHDSKTLENAKTELESKGPVQAVSVDLYDEQQVDEFIERLNTDFTRLVG